MPVLLECRKIVSKALGYGALASMAAGPSAIGIAMGIGAFATDPTVENAIGAMPIGKTGRFVDDALYHGEKTVESFINNINLINSGANVACDVSSNCD